MSHTFVHEDPSKQDEYQSSGSSSDNEESSDDEGFDEVESPAEKLKKRHEDIKTKFDEIRSSLKAGKVDLNSTEELHAFYHKYKDDLGEVTSEDDNHNTLLHLLIEDTSSTNFQKYAPLIRLLVEKHPESLKTPDSPAGLTPLYNAISKKRNDVVRLICETFEKLAGGSDINEILAIKCLNQNCLHVAIAKSVSPDLALFLIQKSNEEVLCAQDSRGNTPLHVAVEYLRCTDQQLRLVKALTSKAGQAMYKQTNSPTYFSPFRYHEYTYSEYLRAKTKKADVKAKTGIVTSKKSESKRTRAKLEEGNVAGGEGQTAKSGVKLRDSQKDIVTKIQLAGGSGSYPIRPVESGNGYYPHDQLELAETRYGSGALDDSTYGISIANKSAKMVGSLKESILENSNVKELAETKNVGFRKSDLKRKTRTDPNDPGTRQETRKVKSRSQEPDSESKVTRGSARAIKDYLKLHCMRSMPHEDALDFLYGRNQVKQIYFDLCDYLSLDLDEEHIRAGLAHLEFEDVLQYVAFPNMKFQKNVTTSKTKKIAKTDNGCGRNDMVFLFDFLRHKGVTRIIRVIVDDREEPSHSDEAIERALGTFGVEIWDWQKFDLCIDTIVPAAPDCTEVHLYWKRNNAILNAWSDPDDRGGGLKRLKRLKTVQLHIGQGLESKKRTEENLENFRQRLNRENNCPNVEVLEPIYESHSGANKLDGPGNAAHSQVAHRHKWLICMDEFADFIQNTPIPPITAVNEQLTEPIIVALIDDGVDMKEQSLHDKVIGGLSFCSRSENLHNPYYVTGGGHGTAMAALICRVCPKVKLYILKLEERESSSNMKQITAKSATKAVRAAINKKVHIISMSWTIPKTKENADDIAKLESAIQDAAEEGILMFCAASDEGVNPEQTFPAAGREKRLFKIGAATEEGTKWKWVGKNPHDVDFIFPGHNVVLERYSEREPSLENANGLTGSSVATALAAGLAALVLYCVQLSALDNESFKKQISSTSEESHLARSVEQQRHRVDLNDFKALRSHSRMSQVFSRGIGISKESFVEVWNIFKDPVGKIKENPNLGKIDIVNDIATGLKVTQDGL